MKIVFGLCVLVATSAMVAGAGQQRPNIVVILSDDMGYSDIGAFGGEINTPHFDKLASGGKILTQFYNTARCCPSRASMLTGLYPHQAGVGHLIYNTGHIGYGDFLTSDSITMAQVLQDAGYGTYMAGKWHLAPRSYDPKKDTKYWPLNRGFDKFYGTICGSGSFWDPATLCRDTTFISPHNDPEYQPEQYYYTDAISDNAIKFVDDHVATKKDKPFFLYMAYTSAHWPLHAPEDAIAEYSGKYGAGYEAIHAARLKRVEKLGLVPNLGDSAPPVGDWSKVENKPVKERLMETYAAMVTRMDDGIGKLVADLKAKGELDNTLIIYLQDNGGCAEDPWPKPQADTTPIDPMTSSELQTRPAPPLYTREGNPIRTGHDLMAGPADVFVAYLEEWANVSNSPFRKYKHFVHEGGISTPLIASWPARIRATSDTAIIRDPAHLIDLMPTLLDAAGAKYPAQYDGVAIQPMEGVSLLPKLTGKGNVDRKAPIFFEHESNRAVRDGKWKLVATAEDGPWELYDMDVDRGEMNDLASQQPDRVKTMAGQWDAWAARSRVLPLGGWRDRRPKADGKGKKSDQASQATADHIYLHQGDKLSPGQSLNLTGKGLTIVAEVLEGPIEGVIVSQGASVNGFSLYAKNGKIHFASRHNKEKGHLEISPIPPVPFTIGVSVEMNGDAQVSTNEGPAVSSTGKRNTVKGKLPGPFVETPTQGLACGSDTETPVANYPSGFDFQGKLNLVVVHTIPNQ